MKFDFWKKQGLFGKEELNDIVLKHP